MKLINIFCLCLVTTLSTTAILGTSVWAYPIDYNKNDYYDRNEMRDRMNKVEAEEKSTLIANPEFIIYRNPGTRKDYVNKYKGLAERAMLATRSIHTSTIHLISMSGMSIELSFLTNAKARKFMKEMTANAVDISDCEKDEGEHFNDANEKDENSCNIQAFHTKFKCGIMSSAEVVLTDVLNKIDTDGNAINHTVDEKNWALVEGKSVSNEYVIPASCPDIRYIP